MKCPWPGFSPVNEWHNDTYDAINPSRAVLSHKGKTVVITGGGSGIGQAIAFAYAAAGAAHIAVIGRRLDKLKETQESIGKKFAAVKVSVHAADMTDARAMSSVASDIGTWNVLVLCAGQTALPASVGDADTDEWWRVFEVNVKGNFVVMSNMLKHKAPSAAIVVISAAMITFPASLKIAAGASAYTSSKAAAVRLLEHVAAENPDVFTIAIHPGVIATDLQVASDIDASDFLDQPELPAHFTVWSTSPEASFLKGRWVAVNWDVDELKGLADKIQDGGDYCLRLSGFPWSPETAV